MPDYRLQPAVAGMDWPMADSDPVVLAAPGQRGIIRWIGPIISLGIIAVAADAFRGVDLDQIKAILPRTPTFWLVFAAAYLAQPVADFVIFRRLWRIPAAGFAALVRKFISNEVLLGYSGELYFYSWARRHSRIVGAPFGAVKDVAILSALIGNAITLAMFCAAWPMLMRLHLGIEGRTLFTSIGVVLVSSLVVMVLRGRLFSLPRAQLGFVAVVQLARVVGATALSALMWSLVLPTVPLLYWLMLATLRLLILRLPLVPNKEVVFAGAAVMMVGFEPGIAPLMAMVAGLFVGAHLIIGTGLVIADLAGWDRA